MKLGHHNCCWLIDTGASISVITYELIERSRLPIHKETLRINGIGGSVQSEGYVYMKLNVNEDVQFYQKFYVFQKLPCHTDGILGQDFLKKTKAVLDFELNKIKLHASNGKSVTLSLKYSNTNSKNFLTVPARSETIHYIHTNIVDECVISSQELCSGVYLPS